MLAFSPPDIGQAEIDEVVDTLKSGWITTGPKTKRLEAELAQFCGTPKVACLSSATAALECALRLLGVGPGDEVITSAYTYTASASPICHVGATPVLVDVAPDSYEMDYDQVAAAVTARTKAVIPVDIAGRMVDYDRLGQALDSVASSWRPTCQRQEDFGRVPVVADGAHSLGARRRGARSGQAADLTTFSFHAVKNFTTAEGGALTWREGLFDDEAAYRDVMLMSLHGQTKDALAKAKGSAGAWEYDIAFPGWKCNMTDIQAALGLAQMKRYDDLMARRHQIVGFYQDALADAGVTWMAHAQGDPAVDGFLGSAHLMMVRLDGRSLDFRNRLIERLAAAGVPSNVHYKPLPLLSAYRDLGFNPSDYPWAVAQYENEITLPLHTLLTDDEVYFVASEFCRVKRQMEAEGLK